MGRNGSTKLCPINQQKGDENISLPYEGKHWQTKSVGTIAKNRYEQVEDDEKVINFGPGEVIAQP